MQVAVFGFVGDGAGRSPVDRYVDELACARSEGFPRVWTAQLPHEPDLLVTPAVALREVPDITVGTGVLPIQVEHRTAMAQRALTVNLISGGRLAPGLGLSPARTAPAPAHSCAPPPSTTTDAGDVQTCG